MNIHEYQAKAVLKEFGVPVSAGVPIFSKIDEAEAAAKKLPGPLWVVKSADPRRRPRQGQVQGSLPAPRAASASPSRSRRS
jgi:succinyl-CoA synthetase beta subunit